MDENEKLTIELIGKVDSLLTVTGNIAKKVDSIDKKQSFHGEHIGRLQERIEYSIKDRDEMKEYIEKKFNTVWTRIDEKCDTKDVKLMNESTTSKMQTWVYRLVGGFSVTLFFMIIGYILDKVLK
jgi:hypothetical protein